MVPEAMTPTPSPEQPESERLKKANRAAYYEQDAPYTEEELDAIDRRNAAEQPEHEEATLDFERIVGEACISLIDLERSCSDGHGQPKKPDPAALFRARLAVAELHELATKDAA